MNESQLAARLATADTDELAAILQSPSLDEELFLRDYLGPECYRRLRSLTQRRAARQRELREPSLGNVLLIPGLLSNELALVQKDPPEPVWLSARSVAAGNLRYLRLAENGITDADPANPIAPTGLMKRYYGELMLTLAQRWQVRTFTYDWRKSLELAASQVRACIDASFPRREPVHLVAAREGGFVARLYVALNADHWAQRGGRLITIGTPYWGSVLYLQALVGHLDIVQWADRLDPHYSRQEFLSLVRTFPSLYQLLPFAEPVPKELFLAATYGSTAGVRQEYLDDARRLQDLVRTVADPARMLAIVGVNQPSYADVHLDAFRDAVDRPSRERISDELLAELYAASDGDGIIARRDAEIAIPTLYLDSSGTDLIGAPHLLGALDELLQSDFTSGDWRKIGQRQGLQAEPPAVLTGSQESSAPAGKPPGLSDQLEQTGRRVEQLARGLARSGGGPGATENAQQEREMENIFMRHLGLSSTARSSVRVMARFDPPKIAIKVVLKDIAVIGEEPSTGEPSLPVDAIAVGHYIGGTPQGGVSALDDAITPLLAGGAAYFSPAKPGMAEGVLHQLLQRRTVSGELAALFCLPDPRAQGKETARVVAVTGMGIAGRFGAPELTILARELCWALGRIGKKHLATVLIGAGQNNLSVADAVEAWIHGIKLAITGNEAGAGNCLQQITFVEHDPRRVAAIAHAIEWLAADLGPEKRNRMLIDFTPFSDQAREEIKAAAIEAMQAEVRQQVSRDWQATQGDAAGEPAPTRITVEFDEDTYRFGALTEGASMPERPIQLDPKLVNQANDELASTADLSEQQRQGEFLAKLLFPEDFYTNLSGGTPLILTVDATTARIHWELLCLSERQLMATDAQKPDEPNDGAADAQDPEMFLGIACGVTRQLRTSFARIPEPMPLQNRLLRVLVVADPAADARLPGAEEEGNSVADLMEIYNDITQTKNRIEVVRLIGPAEASRTTVLQNLMTRSYDVLHFAGHCIYDSDNPRRSGWIFTGGERLTAAEIQRLDRVPSLVFSNACESGVTPDRAGERSAALAPTFAETFFARGVANIVCTAWPVGDREGRDFALTLYAALLGLEFNPPPKIPVLRTDRRYYQANTPQPFHKAMRAARRAIADESYDQHSWGAYQHYGNPYAQIFAPYGSKMAERSA